MMLMSDFQAVEMGQSGWEKSSCRVKEASGVKRQKCRSPWYE